MPRIRRTVPLGSSRLAILGSRRNDLIAAMEVIGPLTARPPFLVRRPNSGRRPGIPPRSAAPWNRTHHYDTSGPDENHSTSAGATTSSAAPWVWPSSTAARRAMGLPPRPRRPPVRHRTGHVGAGAGRPLGARAAGDGEDGDADAGQ